LFRFAVDISVLLLLFKKKVFCLMSLLFHKVGTAKESFWNYWGSFYQTDAIPVSHPAGSEQ